MKLFFLQSVDYVQRLAVQSRLWNPTTDAWDVTEEDGSQLRGEPAIDLTGSIGSVKIKSLEVNSCLDPRSRQRPQIASLTTAPDGDT